MILGESGERFWSQLLIFSCRKVVLSDSPEMKD